MRRGRASALTGALAVMLAWPSAGSGQSPPEPPWRSVRSRAVEVRFAPGDSLLAERVLAGLLAQPPLPALPPGVPPSAVVILAPDERTFVSLAGRLPDWGAGFALPGERTLVIPAYASARSSVGGRPAVLRHEWAHLGLHAYLGGLRVPRWFDEGYARWAEGGFDPAETWRLRLLLALGRAPPLDSLSLAWPEDRASAEAAYLLGASAVAYLVEESGERGIAAFLERWRRDGSFETALRGTYGVTSGQLEEDWRRWVRRRYGWAVALSHSAAVWVLFGVVLVALALRRQRRDRERMARLRATEPPDGVPGHVPWWDEGDPDPPPPADRGAAPHA